MTWRELCELLRWYYTIGCTEDDKMLARGYYSYKNNSPDWFHKIVNICSYNYDTLIEVVDIEQYIFLETTTVEEYVHNASNK
jgi:hypothetical protein